LDGDGGVGCDSWVDWSMLTREEYADFLGGWRLANAISANFTLRRPSGLRCRSCLAPGKSCVVCTHLGPLSVKVAAVRATDPVICIEEVLSVVSDHFVGGHCRNFDHKFSWSDDRPSGMAAKWSRLPDFQDILFGPSTPHGLAGTERSTA
jgi:hypothetical protein